MQRARTIVLTTALAFPAAVAQTAAQPAVHSTGRPVLLTEGDGTDFAVRPATVGYTGDGTGLMAGHGRSVRHPGRIHWTHWGRRSARGHGYAWLNNCRPSCGGGHFHPVKAKISANRSRHGRFTHLAIRYSSGGGDYRKLRHIPRDQYGPGYWQWAYATH
jgi:hypothetical protein